MSFFKIHHRSSRSKARIGTIQTAHGTIQTPAFVPVATKATLKSLLPEQISQIGIQVQFVNTYHLVVHPGADVLEAAAGVHQYSHLPTPLMSDSGGFQVFSLANSSRRAKIHGEEDPFVRKITDDGVIFRSTYDGSLIEFTPELSMHYQQQIGADLIMAFDECTYFPATEKYALKAMNRTHDWLKRCIQFMNKTPSVHGFPQYLYGIIQGGTYQTLRKASAEFVCNLPTPGIAVGGIAVGESKQEMREQVSWIAPFLPLDRPVHMLGIGGFDDIRDLIQAGGDTFDCVEPTRAARMGIIYQWSAIINQFGIPSHFVANSDKIQNVNHSTSSAQNFELDITKTKYRDDLTSLDQSCDCNVCLLYTKSYLHHLFKQKELTGYTLATYHNLSIMEKYMQVMREMIKENML